MGYTRQGEEGPESGDKITCQSKLGAGMGLEVGERQVTHKWRQKTQVLVSERSGSGSGEQGPAMKRASETLVQRELCPGQRLSHGGTRQVPQY